MYYAIDLMKQVRYKFNTHLCVTDRDSGMKTYVLLLLGHTLAERHYA